MTCTNCHDVLWVCESHPDRPWGDDADDGTPDCDCGNCGMPCPACNVPAPGEMPRALPGSIELWRAEYAPPMPN